MKDIAWTVIEQKHDEPDRDRYVLECYHAPDGEHRMSDIRAEIESVFRSQPWTVPTVFVSFGGPAARRTRKLAHLLAAEFTDIEPFALEVTAMQMTTHVVVRIDPAITGGFARALELLERFFSRALPYARRA